MSLLITSTPTFFNKISYKFFSLVRLQGDWDRNPATHLIKYIMRKLSVMQCGSVTPSLNTNCFTPPSSLEEENDKEINPNFEEY